ncbi:hypothetical protein C1645_800583 [Glomus cerebriforme]|uniref:Uncharacterized protein n=1 Tax=Glomus cerebriforme TaxID=658196 RepID=A0A397TNI4_9GLOM|nr:hypothetical protein C1645_800583 [Glomus cerebriforme]
MAIIALSVLHRKIKNIFGMLMNWNKEILSYDVNLNCPYIANDLPTVATNINLDGFIVISKDVNHQLTWNEFIFSHETAQVEGQQEQSEKLSVILDSIGTFSYPNQTDLIDYSVFGTVEGTYGVLILLQNLDIKNVDLINSYQAQPIYMVYLAFIRTNTIQILQRPTLIYETSEVQITWIHIQSCKVGFVDHANICFLKSIVNRGGFLLSATVEISFLSSGSVVNIEQLGLDNNIEQSTPNNNVNNNNITDSVIPLENDGLLLIRHAGNALIGRIYDQNENNTGRVWDIPGSLTTNNRLLGFGVFKNNTVWIALDNLNNLVANNYIFRILSSDMPKFIKDYGYHNLLVTSTEPKINDTLLTPYPDKINITYSIPITPGPGNITIYQNDERNTLTVIRQTFSGNSKYCQIDEDERTTISCDILKSTFNLLNTPYTVKIDNNFVKSSLLDEPLLGIPDGFWTFKTNASSNENTHTNDITILLRLNNEGTKLFSKKKEFLDNLHKELSDVIPTKSDRLNFTDRVQNDASTPSGRILIELNILAGHNPNSLQVLDNLKTLIENKDITMISSLNHTKFLDETYGVYIVPSLWGTVKYLFIGFLLICIILGSLYLWARYRHPEGHNSAIFKVPLVLFDLVMDILFVIYDGKTFPSLFIPSADVEELNILKSKIAGLEVFSAPYSQVGLSWILAGSALNVLTTDLPQVIIQGDVKGY